MQHATRNTNPLHGKVADLEMKVAQLTAEIVALHADLKAVRRGAPPPKPAVKR